MTGLSHNWFWITYKHIMSNSLEKGKIIFHKNPGLGETYQRKIQKWVRQTSFRTQPAATLWHLFQDLFVLLAEFIQLLLHLLRGLFVAPKEQGKTARNNAVMYRCKSLNLFEKKQVKYSRPRVWKSQKMLIKNKFYTTRSCNFKNVLQLLRSQAKNLTQTGLGFYNSIFHHLQAENSYSNEVFPIETSLKNFYIHGHSFFSSPYQLCDNHILWKIWQLK